MMVSGAPCPSDKGADTARISATARFTTPLVLRLWREAGMGRNRALALGIVGAFLGLLRWLAAAPDERVAWLYLVALPLGYGHLLGALVFARRRTQGWSRQGESSALFRAFIGSSVLTLLAAYSWALHAPVLQPLVLGPMLMLSAWHIVENDLALGRAYRIGLRLGPVTRAVRHHGIALALTVSVGVAALSTREGLEFARVFFGRSLVPVQSWLMLDELATGVLLYHAVSWLIFFEDRACALANRSAAEAARLRRRVLALHALPLALNAALYLWLPAIHFYVAAPTLYLFWSVLHAIQTAAVRGFEPRPATP